MKRINKLIITSLVLILFVACSKDNEKDLEMTDQDSNYIIRKIELLADEKFKSKAFEDLANIQMEPKLKIDDEKKLKDNIRLLAAEDTRARWIYENFDQLSQTEKYLVGNDKDTIEFIYNLNNDITDFDYLEGESKEYGRETPYYLQWDNRRAYEKLGTDNIGIAGCGPTSMAMVLARLKNDPSITPKTVASEAQSYMVEDGISRSFFDDEAKKYDLKIEAVPLDENSMIESLQKGPLLVSVNRGYFTLFGHILVIDSYSNGKFVINDPNSYKNSQRSRSYQQISDQIAKIRSIHE